MIRKGQIFCLFREREVTAIREDTTTGTLVR